MDRHGHNGAKCLLTLIAILLLHVCFHPSSPSSSSSPFTLLPTSASLFTHPADGSLTLDTSLQVEGVDVGPTLTSSQSATNHQADRLASQRSELDSLQEELQELEQALANSTAIAAEQALRLVTQAETIAEQARWIGTLQQYAINNTAHLALINATANELTQRTGVNEQDAVRLLADAATIREHASQLNATLDEHASHLTELNATLAQHAVELTELYARDDTIRDGLDEIAANATTLTQRQLQVELTEVVLTSRITDQETDVAALEGRMDSAETLAAHQLTTSNQYQQRLDDLDSLTSTHATRLTELDQVAAATKTDVLALQHNDTVTESKITTERTAATLLEQRVANAEQLAATTSQLVDLILDLQQRTTSHATKLQQLEAALQAANVSIVKRFELDEGKITDLNNRLTTLDSKRTVLQSDTSANLTQLLDGVDSVTQLLLQFHIPKLYRVIFLASSTWTVPVGTTSAQFTMAGGGASGYGWRGLSAWATGASGGYVFSQPATLVPGETLTITVGQGGVGERPIKSSTPASPGPPFYIHEPPTPTNAGQGLMGNPGGATVITSPTNGELLRCAGGSPPTVVYVDSWQDATASKLPGGAQGALFGSGNVTPYYIGRNPASGAYSSEAGPGACGPNDWGIGNLGLQSYNPADGIFSGGMTPFGYGSGGTLTRDSTNCYVNFNTIGVCVSPADGRDGVVFIDVMY